MQIKFAIFYDPNVSQLNPHPPTFGVKYFLQVYMIRCICINLFLFRQRSHQFTFVQKIIRQNKVSLFLLIKCTL